METSNLLTKELPKRFTDAVGKLYDAYHNNLLEELDCSKCAVGNICNGSDLWYDAVRWNYTLVGKTKKVIEKTGYTVMELRNIESLFMHGIMFTTDHNKKAAEWSCDEDSKYRDFKGLCAVIEYLCELDNIPNITSYQSLFNPKKVEVN